MPEMWDLCYLGKTPLFVHLVKIQNVGDILTQLHHVMTVLTVFQVHTKDSACWKKMGMEFFGNWLQILYIL